MTAKYIFTSEGLFALAQYVARDSLFAFDLDGTLAPIVAEHSSAKVGKPIRLTLERLATLAKVAVITGRSRKDAMSILGFEPHLLVGNHGAEWPCDKAGRNWEQVRLSLKWREQLYEMLCSVTGVEIEFKGESVSIHYRKADNPEQVLILINSAIEALDPRPQRYGGKFVVNLLPPGTLNKGDALIAAMEMFGLKRSIFIGDDVTDEAVFQLKHMDVFGIHIGRDSETAAPYYLKKQTALLGILNSIVGMLETQNIQEIRS